MNKQQWNALCRDMLPLLEEMTEVLNKHKYKKIFAPAISADGYVSVDHVDHGDDEKFYRFYRYSKGYTTEIELNFENIKEEVEVSKKYTYLNEFENRYPNYPSMMAVEYAKPATYFGESARGKDWEDEYPQEELTVEEGR